MNTSIAREMALNIIARVDQGWTLQGFGLFRLYLSKEVHLHVWSPTKHAKGNATRIHTHPWDFSSHVLVGAITDIVYKRHVSVDPRVLEAFAKPHPTHREERIVCGPGGGLVSDPMPSTYVRLVEEQKTTYESGGSYWLDGRRVHESSAADGTVTVIARTFHEDTEHALVYPAWDRYWISAEPRDATPEEVAEMRAIVRARVDLEKATARR